MPTEDASRFRGDGVASRPVFKDDETDREILQIEVDDDIDVISDVTNDPKAIPYQPPKIEYSNQRCILQGHNINILSSFNFFGSLSKD